MSELLIINKDRLQATYDEFLFLHQCFNFLWRYELLLWLIIRFRCPRRWHNLVSIFIDLNDWFDERLRALNLFFLRFLVLDDALLVDQVVVGDVYRFQVVLLVAVGLVAAVAWFIVRHLIAQYHQKPLKATCTSHLIVRYVQVSQVRVLEFKEALQPLEALVRKADLDKTENLQAWPAGREYIQEADLELSAQPALDDLELNQLPWECFLQNLLHHCKGSLFHV